MPIHILMPALSPRMTEGRLARWLVGAGDRVEAGMIIAEIETPTATMEIEAVDAGVVREILVPAGSEGVAVDAPIAVLVTEAELGRGAGPADRAVSGAASASEARPAARPARGGPGSRTLASPVARKRAKERAVDLETVSGSGPGGRIVLRDVEPAPVPLRLAEPRGRARPGPVEGEHLSATPPEAFGAARRSSGAVPEPDGPPVAQVPAIYDASACAVVVHSPTRIAAARRLMAAQSTVPQLRLAIDCRLDDAQKALSRLSGRGAGNRAGGAGLALEHLVVKAFALALQAVPEANAVYTPEAALRHGTVHIAVEHAVEGESVWPVLRHAELRSLSEIADELADLARRAGAGTLSDDDVGGAAAALSILGGGAARLVEGVLVPPAATLLMLGAPERRPLVGEGDRVEVATVVTAALTADARLIDARVAGALLGAFRGYLEEPLRMLV